MLTDLCQIILKVTILGCTAFVPSLPLVFPATVVTSLFFAVALFAGCFVPVEHDSKPVPEFRKRFRVAAGIPDRVGGPEDLSLHVGANC